MSEQVSTNTGLTVVRPGVQTTLQDLGRYGGARFGMSQGGAMDLHAHGWANKLLANPVTCATLEITIGMAAFRANSNLQLAIAGADMQALLDDQAVGQWCSFSMEKGQILTLKAARNGMRAYLAVKGGFQAESVLGSVSTVFRNQLGRLLQEGDHVFAAPSISTASRYVPSRYIPEYSDEIELRIIESYQVADFSSQALEQFYQSEYTVTQDSDRMGVRLEGHPVTCSKEGIISEGLALGAIQIPADGQPIILLNDRQTLGGYPKIGCVARVDLPKLAQARPGVVVRFSPVSITKARGEMREFSRFFRLS